jgi:hypothetical protein
MWEGMHIKAMLKLSSYLNTNEEGLLEAEKWLIVAATKKGKRRRLQI